MPKYYDRIAEICKIALEADDMIGQDEFFALTDKIIHLTHDIAIDEGKIIEQVRKFPYLYK